MKKEEEKKKKRKWLILLLILLLLITAGGAYWYFFVDKDEEIPTTVVAGNFLPNKKDASAMTKAEIAKYAQKAVDSSQFQMVIGSEINVNSNDNSSDLYIQNPPNNAYPVAVTITLSDGTVVYTSGAIEVGYEVKNATLDTHLNKGSYTGTALFKLYDPKTSEEKGQVAAEVTFSVT